MAVPLMCCAADIVTLPSKKQVVLVGHQPSVEFENMLVAAHASYDPNKTVSVKCYYLKYIHIHLINVSPNSAINDRLFT